MAENKDTFEGRKLSSKKGIERDGYQENCKGEKRSMPSLIIVSFDI
jgi:hypothetical protein